MTSFRRSPGGEAVVFRPGAGEGGMAVEQAAQEVRREESALGADGLEFLAGAGHVGLISHQPRQQDVHAQHVGRQHRLDGYAVPRPRGGMYPLVHLALDLGPLPCATGLQRNPELREPGQRVIELLLQGGREEITFGLDGQ